MADLASSAVVTNRTWNTTLSNASVFYEKAVTVTFVSQGTAVVGSLVPASAFGLTSIEEVTPLVKSDNTEIIPAGPSADRANILIKAAGTAAPAAISGVYSFVVKGY